MNFIKKNGTHIYLTGIIILTLLFGWFGFQVFQPNTIRDTLSQTLDYQKTTITEVLEEMVQPDPYVEGAFVGYQIIQLELGDGSLYTIRNPISRLYNLHVQAGDKMIAMVQLQSNEVENVTLHSFDRSGMLAGLTLLFIAAIVCVGKMKGFRSLVALAFTGSLIFGIFIPSLFHGASPIVMAIIVAGVSTFVTMTLLNGWQTKTWLTIAGTVFGVCLAGLISYVVGEMTHLSGATLVDSENLFYLAEQSGMQVKGLMFAAILIASLGAVMDVAMSIVSSMAQFISIHPQISVKELFDNGMEVGKDIIGTMSNTLILAFVGSSLTSLILLMAMELPVFVLLNNDFVATELIQSFAGSIGIIATVPVTALLASYVMVKIKKK